MNLLRKAVGLCLRLCWLLVGVLSVASVADAVEPIHTKDNTFYIPYTVAVQPNGQPPSQVQLYVSGDQGVTWEQYASQPPGQDHRFAFRAGIDGEFWFAVRTIGSDGTPDKPEVNRAELVVIVDQQPPTVELNASASRSNEIALEWTVRDEGIDAESIQIEYQQAPSGSWTVVPNLAQANDNGTTQESLQGSTSWTVNPPVESVSIRATVRDKAGNTTVMERSVGLGQVAATQTPDVPWPPQQASQNQVVENGRHEPSGWRSSPTPTGPVPTDSMGLLPPANGPVGNMLPPISSDGFQATPNEQFTPSNQTATPSRNERISRSQRFQLEYEIEGVNSIAVHRVEIWASHDNGQTWRHLGDDEDKQSPYLVTVPNDGIFGFRLLVQAQEGLPVRPPLSGDLPDVWVRVDSTVPTVRLTNARYGRGAELGQLIVTWNATDDDLTTSPVTLLFGESSNGPWRIAAENLPNTGAYSWGVDDRIPSELYLRVEVQDRAGNIGNDTLTSPIRADGLLPKGKIRNVRPASHVESAWPTATAAPSFPTQPAAPVQAKSFTERMRDRLRF